MNTQQLIDQFSLPEDRLDYYQNNEQGADGWRWLFGYTVLQDFDEIDGTVQAEFGGKLNDRAIESLARKLKAKALRQAAQRAGITRSTASKRKSNSEFFNGAESEFNFTWHQFDAIKSAGDDWYNFVHDVLLPKMDEFGGEVATVEAIRIEAKKWRGDDPGGDDDPLWLKHTNDALVSLDRARAAADGEVYIKELLTYAASDLAAKRDKIIEWLAAQESAVGN